MWEPEATAQAMGVRVRVTHRLPLGLLGAWQPDRGTIWLRPDLRPRQLRAVLGHEVVHVEQGDGQCTLDLLARKRERRVETAAARRLITLPELGSALVSCASLHDLANELVVDMAMARHRLTIARDDPAESAYLERVVGRWIGREL